MRRRRQAKVADNCHQDRRIGDLKILVQENNHSRRIRTGESGANAL
jgi:hypothetical protein